jgi:hypothetical protein
MRTGEIMTRTSLFAQFSKLMTVALDRNEACLHHAKMTRRSFLKKVGVLGVTITGVPALLESRPKDSNLDVGIVGAGLAGLVCADTLRTNGVRATI